MIYEFEAPDGRRIDMDFPIGSAPQKVAVDGIEYERVFSLSVVIPATMKAGYDTDKRRAFEFKNNQTIADKIAADDKYYYAHGEETPGWVKSDLDNRIAKKKGKTRLG